MFSTYAVIVVVVVVVVSKALECLEIAATLLVGASDWVHITAITLAFDPLLSQI